jgi:hypothetical protein
MLLFSLKVTFIPTFSFVKGGAENNGDVNLEGWVSM